MSAAMVWMKSILRGCRLSGCRRLFDGIENTKPHLFAIVKKPRSPSASEFGDAHFATLAVPVRGEISAVLRMGNVPDVSVMVVRSEPVLMVNAIRPVAVSPHPDQAMCAVLNMKHGYRNVALRLDSSRTAGIPSIPSGMSAGSGEVVSGAPPPFENPSLRIVVQKFFQKGLRYNFSSHRLTPIRLWLGGWLYQRPVSAVYQHGVTA